MTLHWTYKITLIVHTRNLTISCFYIHLSSKTSIANHQTVTKFHLWKTKNSSNQENFNAAKVNTKMCWRSRVIMLIWNTPTANQKKMKRRKQNIIWFNPPFSKSVSTNFAKTFLQLEKNISQEATSFTKFSTAIQLKSATVAWTIYQNLARDIIKKSCRNHMTKDQNAIAEKNQNVQWKGTVKLTTYFAKVT